MKLRRTAGLAASLIVLSAAPALAAGPADVTVRIEGASQTLVPASSVHTSVTPVNKSGNAGEDCTGTSAAGALEQATHGDWGGTWFGSFGYSLDRVFAESHPTTDPAGNFWTFWVNHKSSSTGICGTELQEGDDVLFFVDQCSDPQPPDYACKNDPVLPLELRGAPSSEPTGGSAQVTVVRYDQQGNVAPVSGATVSGSGADAVSGTDGTATVTFPAAGTVTLKASKSGFARSEGHAVTVADASSGTPAPTPAPVARDTTAPTTKLSAPRDGHRYSRRHAPRRLRGSVSADPSGIQAVKLSLTRRSGGKCTLYSPTQERFRRSRCGKHVYFKIGDREAFDYLLPSKLGHGRYVLDAVGIDKAGNRDSVRRGRNRAVFTVR